MFQAINWVRSNVPEPPPQPPVHLDSQPVRTYMNQIYVASQREYLDLDPKLQTKTMTM